MNFESDGLRFGVYLPAYVLPGEPVPSAAFLQDFARRAEDLGFDSLWVVDHLFESPPSYRVVFMEPVSSLALAIGATKKVTLGTGILVLSDEVYEHMVYAGQQHESVPEVDLFKIRLSPSPDEIVTQR